MFKKNVSVDDGVFSVGDTPTLPLLDDNLIFGDVALLYCSMITYVKTVNGTQFTGLKLVLWYAVLLGQPNDSTVV